MALSVTLSIGWLHTHNIGIVLMSCVRVYVLLTCFPAIISHNMFRSKIYHKASNYIHELLCWIHLKASPFPIKIIPTCEAKRVLGRDHQYRCHYLTMVTRWCAFTTVMLWSCSYETWRTNLAEGLFISFCGAVCALRHTSLGVLQPGLVRVLYMSVGTSACLSRLLSGRMSACFKFVCVAEIGFTWDGGSLHQQILWSN